MLNGLLKDAIKVANKILEITLPNDKVIVINLRKTSFDGTVGVATPDEAENVFYYEYDQVPKLFEQEGIFEIQVPNRWYIGENYENGNVIPKFDKKAEELGLLSKGASLMFYENDYDPRYRIHKAGEPPTSPTNSKLITAIVNIQKLKEFVNWYSNLAPKFDLEIKTVKFLGREIPIDGDIESKYFACLMENIDSIVTHKELFELRGKNYDTAISGNKKTSVHDINKKVIEAIKEKIKKDEILSNALIIVQNDGFGLFVNKRALNRTPSP
jgi:hypothetical protein